MGLIDRAFGADKHTLANWDFIIYWKAALQRFQEHGEKCSLPADIEICTELIAICNETLQEIEYAKKGFGVFVYEKPFFHAQLARVVKLVNTLDNKFEEIDKISELIINTSNILERKYR
jgi:hypothetical protein